MSYRRIIVGPIFFGLMITTKMYRLIITDFIPLPECSEADACQQDNVHPHTVQETVQFLQSFFADWLIFTSLLPSHSPNLSPLDFHLWGDLKEKVFETVPATIIELQRLSREKWDDALYSRTAHSIGIFSKQVCSVFQDEAIEHGTRSQRQFNNERYRFS